MKEVAKGGRTVLFVSHNMGAIHSLCENAILLDNGKIMKNGSADEVVSDYFTSQTELFDESASVMERDHKQIINKSFYIARFELLNTKNVNTNIFRYNEDLIFIVSLEGSENESFSTEFYIYNELGQLVSVGSSRAYHGVYFNKNIKKIRIKIESLSLTGGKYSISLSLVKGIDGTGVSRADTWQNAGFFTIIECKPIETHWEIPSFREVFAFSNNHSVKLNNLEEI